MLYGGVDMKTAMRKGQAATEYLMTYGWALLAIAIVGAILYYQVFSNRACGAGGATGFDMVNTVVPTGTFTLTSDTNGNVNFQIQLENRMEIPVNVTEITFNGIAATLTGAPITLQPGEQKVVSGSVTISGAKPGKCYNLQTEIYFIPQGFTQPKKNAGTLSGKY